MFLGFLVRRLRELNHLLCHERVDALHRFPNPLRSLAGPSGATSWGWLVQSYGRPAPARSLSWIFALVNYAGIGLAVRGPLTVLSSIQKLIPCVRFQSAPWNNFIHLGIILIALNSKSPLAPGWLRKSSSVFRIVWFLRLALHSWPSDLAIVS